MGYFIHKIKIDKDDTITTVGQGNDFRAGRIIDIINRIVDRKTFTCTVFASDLGRFYNVEIQIDIDNTVTTECASVREYLCTAGVILIINYIIDRDGFALTEFEVDVFTYGSRKG